MWTRKRVGVKCPRCGGDVDLTVDMYAKEIGTFSLAGAQLKVSAETAPTLRCAGNYDPELGEPLWPECEWIVRGRFDGAGSALFDPLVP